MICIVDSGSTKADWAVLAPDGELFQTFTTGGMNPVVGFDKGKITSRLQSFINTLDRNEIEKIYFYGAGCVDDKRNGVIQSFLKSVFSTNTNIEVSSDLTGAAMACFGNKKGFIGIIGTGSSAAYFDGQKITAKAGALGYLISDDGSGYHIGRNILRSYFHQQMPLHLKEDFEESYKKELKDIYKKIYKTEKPNTAVASFTKFLATVSADPFVSEVLSSSFDSYFKNIVSQMSDMKVKKKICFVGSVAYNFAAHLKESAAKNDFETIQILERPIHRLVFHYRQQLNMSN